MKLGDHWYIVNATELNEIIDDWGLDAASVKSQLTKFGSWKYQGLINKKKHFDEEPFIK